MSFLVYKISKDGGRVKFPACQCKGRRAFVVSSAGDWGSLLFSFDRSVNLSLVSLGYIHLHPADDSGEELSSS